MKKLTMLLMVALLLSCLPNYASAQDRGINGFLFGAGGGALIGQAIGRNTESTLIGTAVGSMLGYIVGNEHDKYGVGKVRTSYQPVKQRYNPPVKRYESQFYYTEDRPHRTSRDNVCKETEMLATINGRAEKVYGTACLEDGEWVMDSDDVNISQTIFLDNDRKWRKSGKHRASHRRNRNSNHSWARNDRYYYRSSW